MLRFKKVAVFLCLLSLIVMPLGVLAVDVQTYIPSEFQNQVGQSLPTEGSLETTIAKIINVALGFLGIIAVIIILIGGFMWMTAGGNEDKVGKAKKLLVAGIIGLAIILSAYVIAKFIISKYIEALTNQS
jgi:type IV secretory pathway VirB2 component (pilin)